MATDQGAKEHGGRFRLGINYWPARTSIAWWAHFDRVEVAADFARIAAHGFDSVRLFLTWEDFQPAADRVDASMLRRLVLVLDLADAAGSASARCLGLAADDRGDRMGCTAALSGP